MEKNSVTPQPQQGDSVSTNVSQTQMLTSTVTTLCTDADDVNPNLATSSSSQQPPKYQVFYDRLYKCLSFLESENRKLLDMIRNKISVTSEPIPFENLLDEFALKVNSKKDEFEKNQVAQAVGEGQQAFMAKRWKMRYQNLLDLALILEKKLNISGDKEAEASIGEQLEQDKLCDEATSFPWDPEKNVTRSANLIIDDIALELDSHSAERSLTNYDQNDFTILLSSVFIQDLLANYNRCTEEVKRQNETKCRLFHILKKTKDQRNQLKRCVSDQEGEIKNMQRKIQEIEAALSRFTRNPSAVTSGSADQNDLASVRTGTAVCDEAQVGGLLHPTTGGEAEEDQVVMQQLLAEVHQLEYRKKELEEMLSEEEQQRRFLSKRIQDLIGTIHVSCRIRPHPDNYLQVMSDDKILCPKALPHPLASRLPGHMNNEDEETASQMRCFIFEKVYGPDASHQDIFKKLAQSLTTCLDGHNFCVMTYGPKRSGKSFTMFGASADLTVDSKTLSTTGRGLAQEALHYLLAQSGQRMGWKYEFRVRILAVTDEKVTDLLEETQIGGGCPNLVDVTEDPINNRSSGLTSNDEFDKILWTTLQDEKRRGCHQPYHLIVKVTIKGTQKLATLTPSSCDSGSSGTSVIDGVRSTILFADLASWEKQLNGNIFENGLTINKPNESGLSPEVVMQTEPAQVKEKIPFSHHHHQRKNLAGQPSVNQSLMALSRIFTALRRRKPLLYYDSLLTRILGPVLSSENSKCFLIITINPDPGEFAPTLASLQFAQNVMQASTRLGVDLKARQQLPDQLQDQPGFVSSVCMPAGAQPGQVDQEDGCNR